MDNSDVRATLILYFTILILKYPDDLMIASTVWKLVEPLV